MEIFTGIASKQIQQGEIIVETEIDSNEYRPLLAHERYIGYEESRNVGIALKDAAIGESVTGAARGTFTIRNID